MSGVEGGIDACEALGVRFIKAKDFLETEQNASNTKEYGILEPEQNASKMLLSMGIGSIIGPIQMGLQKPVYFTNANTSEREIVDLITIASLEAIILGRQ